MAVLRHYCRCFAMTVSIEVCTLVRYVSKTSLNEKLRLKSLWGKQVFSWKTVFIRPMEFI